MQNTAKTKQCNSLSPRSAHLLLRVLQPLLESGNVLFAVLDARVSGAEVILGGGQFLSQLLDHIFTL